VTARIEETEMTTMTKTMTSTRWVACLATAALAVSACNNDALTNINQSPNSPTSAPAPALFTNGVRNSVGRWLGTTYDLRGTEFVTQHMAEVQYPDEDAYRRLQAGFTTATFDSAYVNELEDLHQVIKSGQAANNALIYAPALVMRTWDFDYLTDTWGDVPYFQSLQGDTAGTALVPMYDKQQAIYADFFTVLDQASKALTTSPPAGASGFAGADPIYGGNTTAWQRFANSLRARLAMRIVNVDPATARTQFLAAMAAPGGLFTSNADNAIFKWPGGGINDNPWSINFQTRDDNRLSNRLTANMVPFGDPRIAVYGMPDDSTGQYVGLENALTQSQATSFVSTTSRPGFVFMPGGTSYGISGGSGATFPSFLMTYAEVSLLEAEAAERGWIPGSAAAFYTQGIRASMAQWGVTDEAAVSAYLANASVVYQPGAAGLAQIATQKWIALYSDGGQAWAEWRRTCRPSNLHPGPTAIINEIPRRFEYSTTETAVNQAGVAAAIADQGPDNFLSRMWWDRNPTAAPTYVTGCGQKP
jgi:hypothetical protein